MTEKKIDFKVDYSKLNIISEHNTKEPRYPMVLSVPHSGRVFPQEFLDRVEQATPEEPLRWDCEAGSFAAYFQRATGETQTTIRVPASLEYSVSGNNRDGFVVIASVG